MIRIDEEKLREVAKRRGLHSFEEISQRAGAMNLKLAVATIYSIAANANWTRDKLEVLCKVLECDPRDFVYFEREAPKAVAPIRESAIIENAVA